MKQEGEDKVKDCRKQENNKWKYVGKRQMVKTKESCQANNVWLNEDKSELHIWLWSVIEWLESGENKPW